ncbi:hypothetical protein [Halobacillus campisalis]|uniref:Lipoprotein n=1 Tax=Halobacillus campisalis TaxID=435909 RepID=A0ABW2K0F0_9BACI|nr:hypothetical protein [Halobacillus campisalis]
MSKNTERNTGIDKTIKKVPLGYGIIAPAVVLISCVLLTINSIKDSDYIFSFISGSFSIVVAATLLINIAKLINR